jgi:hypothetical protein
MIRYQLTLSVGIFTAILFSSCAVKTEFTADELRWLNVYNEGDTLIFRSEDGQFDTSYIIKKEIYYPEYMPVEVHGKYLPHSGTVWYKNKKLTYHPNGQRLIQIVKKEPHKDTYVLIDYLYGLHSIPDINDAKFKQLKESNVYEFDTFHPRGKPDQPKKIYWDENWGIVRYVTHDNMTWQRINLSK